MTYELSIMASIIGSIIAIVPAFCVFIYFARKQGKFWLTGVVGGSFWLVAYQARMPILIPLNLLPEFLPWASYPILIREAIVYSIYLIATVCSGLFEEGIKFWFTNRRREYIETPRHVMCFGLGWGLSEALIIYVMNAVSIIVLIPLLPLLPPDLLPSDPELAMGLLAGGVERVSSIVFHVAMTFLVAFAVWHLKRHWAYLAMFLHFIGNFIMVITLRIMVVFIGYNVISIWTIEGLIAVLAIINVLLVYFLWRKLGGPPIQKSEEPPPELTEELQPQLRED